LSGSDAQECSKNEAAKKECGRDYSNAEYEA
jgi:hypothetical protein